VLLAVVGIFVLTIVVLGGVAYKSFRAHEPELRASAAPFGVTKDARDPDLDLVYRPS